MKKALEIAAGVVGLAAAAWPLISAVKNARAKANAPGPGVALNAQGQLVDSQGRVTHLHLSATADPSKLPPDTRTPEQRSAADAAAAARQKQLAQQAQQQQDYANELAAERTNIAAGLAAGTLQQVTINGQATVIGGSTGPGIAYDATGRAVVVPPAKPPSPPAIAPAPSNPPLPPAPAGLSPVLPGEQFAQTWRPASNLKVSTR